MWETSTRLPVGGMSRNGPIFDPFGDPKIYIEGDPGDPDAKAVIDDYSIFTDRGGEITRAVPDGGK